MNRAELQQFMGQEAGDFEQFCARMTEQEFADRSNGRWSVGDTAQHLYLSARPVLRLLAGPRDVFAQWGKAEGHPRTYELISGQYQQVLSKGLKAPANFTPRPDDVPDNKAAVLARLTDTYLDIAAQLANWSEDELDLCQIPHPALGLISMRDMLYFISIHTRHHMAVLQAY